MNQRAAAEVLDDECPFVRPSFARRGTALYCRLPNGRIRIPGEAERRLYCVTGDYEACPIFQRYAPGAQPWFA